MRVIKLLVLLAWAGGWGVGAARAHDVCWWENPFGFTPNVPMEFYYPEEFYDYIGVAPSQGEPCTVVVNLNPPTSTLISATVLEPNPANVVEIRLQILRAPSNNVETATVTGEWHATGLPAGNDCTAVTPNQFSVPVTVIGQVPFFKATLSMNRQWLMVDTGFNTGIKYASSLQPGATWWSVGMGQMFKLPVDMVAGYVIRDQRLGGFIDGTIKDNLNAPLSGLKIGLIYGGSSYTTLGNGSYSLPRLSYGYDVLTITNPVVPGGPSLNVVVENTNNTTANFKVAMAAEPPAASTNACNCTPWCAIGFGTGTGGQTPVYFSGGANPPPSGVASCGTAVVTVTPPSGPPFNITPGRYRTQNSGANPASGTWTVTTTVCGITKTASVTVP